MSNFLWPHALQHSRLPCITNSWSLLNSHHWVGDAIQLAHICHSFLFSYSIFPSISIFSKESAFASNGQSIWVSASASVLQMNIQDWFPSGLTWISLQSKGLSKVFSNTTVQKHQFFSAKLSLWSCSHIRTWLLEKNIALTRWTFAGKVISLPFYILSRMVMTILQEACVF